MFLWTTLRTPGAFCPALSQLIPSTTGITQGHHFRHARQRIELPINPHKVLSCLNSHNIQTTTGFGVGGGCNGKSQNFKNYEGSDLRSLKKSRQQNRNTKLFLSLFTVCVCVEITAEIAAIRIAAMSDRSNRLDFGVWKRCSGMSVVALSIGISQTWLF